MICKSKYIPKVYSIDYTLRKNTNVEKIFFRKNKLYKTIYSFFFSELQLITVLFLIHNDEQKFHLYKTVCEIFNFRFRLAFDK